jgi:hypothetical protein
MGGFTQTLTETQTGLIPNVGDFVNMAGTLRRITRRGFHFHNNATAVEVHFATEDVAY